MQARADKLVSVELLRFAAALVILIWHFQHFSWLPQQGFVIDRSLQPFYGVLWWAYQHGWLAVQLFWALSGLIFFYRYWPALAGGMVAGSTFFWQRFSRLYPLHLFSLLLVAALQWLYGRQYHDHFVYAHNDGWHFVQNLLFASHWGWQQGYSFNGPVWSVSLEVLVYALFFVLLSRFRLLAAYALAALTAAILWRAGAQELAECIAYFFAGGLLSLWRGASLAGPAARWRQSLPWLVLAAGWLLWWAAGAPWGGWPPLAVFSLLQATLAVNRWLQGHAATCQWLGNLTYASYLLHFPLQLALVLLLPLLGWQPGYQQPALLLLFVALSLVLAAVAYRWLEYPAQQFLRHRARPALVATMRVV